MFTIVCNPRQRALPDIICLHEQQTTNLSNVAKGVNPSSGAVQQRW